jgi:hypothetical protein
MSVILYNLQEAIFILFRKFMLAFSLYGYLEWPVNNRYERDNPVPANVFLISMMNVDLFFFESKSIAGIDPPEIYFIS